MSLTRTFRRVSGLVTLLAANMGAIGSTPLLSGFGAPVAPPADQCRWLAGLYLDVPEEWDDPHRCLRW